VGRWKTCRSSVRLMPLKKEIPTVSSALAVCSLLLFFLPHLPRSRSSQPTTNQPPTNLTLSPSLFTKPRSSNYHLCSHHVCSCYGIGSPGLGCCGLYVARSISLQSSLLLSLSRCASRNNCYSSSLLMINAMLMFGRLCSCWLHW
jgi:hypothetical protein